jgi:diguanylate cyclase (GGDEF)-like protein
VARRRPNTHGTAEFLDLILRHLPAFVLALDRDLRFTFIRGRGLENLGVDDASGNALIGKSADEYFTHGEGPQILEYLHNALNGKGASFEADWANRCFTAHATPLRSDGGRIVGVLIAGMDITARRDLQRALEQERQALDDAQQLAEVGSWVLDISSGNLRISTEMARLLGIEHTTEPLRFRDLKAHLQPHDFTMLEAEKERVLRTCGSYDFDHDIVRPDGTVRHVRSRGHVECSADGKPERCMGTILDITQRVEAQRTVELLAYHDPLTGLPNRSLLRDRLTYAIAAARREQIKLYVLFIDLDAFKRINDSLGHAEGDVLLAEVAQRLRHTTRSTDTVARTGGDEFVVLLTEIRSEEDLETAVRKVRSAFRAPFRLRDGDHTITASIGLAVYPDDALTEDELLKDADSAMYDAKQRGRNTVRRYRGASLASTVRRVQLEVDLPRALRQGEFRIYYQPVVHAKTLRITGVEALLRWQHPTRGLLLPVAFLDAVEDSEYVKVIGEWVVREAAAQVAAWRQHFGMPLRLSINISARQLLRNNFPRAISTALRGANLSPEAIDLEITETTLVRDLEWASTVLAKIRELGVGIAIDDFGTGYNSLSYLKHFPVTALKIDRSFVGEIGVDAFDEAISSAVAALGKSLRMRVVAEGVETHKQLTSLRALGCDELQGFYFAPPLEAERLESRLAIAAAE